MLPWDSTCSPEILNQQTHISKPHITHKKTESQIMFCTNLFQHLRIEDGLKICRNVSLNKPFRLG